MIKKFRQQLYALFSAIILICGSISGVFCITTSTNKSNAESVALGAYYYNQLNGIEKKFYNAIRTNHASGVLKRGGSYNLTSAGVVSAGMVNDYANGNQELLVAFEKATFFG